MKNIVILLFICNYWFSAYSQPAYETLIDKFNQADIILLGETHWVKHEMEFVKLLIGKLPANHVNNIGFELLDFRLQADVDSLINAQVFNEKFAKEILFQSKPD